MVFAQDNGRVVFLGGAVVRIGTAPIQRQSEEHDSQPEVQVSPSITSPMRTLGTLRPENGLWLRVVVNRAATTFVE